MVCYRGIQVSFAFRCFAESLQQIQAIPFRPADPGVRFQIGSSGNALRQPPFLRCTQNLILPEHPVTPIKYRQSHGFQTPPQELPSCRLPLHCGTYPLRPKEYAHRRTEQQPNTKVAVVYVIFGLVIAVVGGTFIEKMHLENYVEDFIRNASAVDIDSPTLTQKERLEYAKDQVVSTFKKVFPYILVGVGIGALIHNWIPEVWVESILGSNNPFGVILATLIGIPMYADIFGTIPIAEALLAKGAQLGTILSFMMAVTTLSLPSLIMLRKAIKPKLLGIFIAICAIGIIVVGYVFNGLQNFLI